MAVITIGAGASNYGVSQFGALRTALDITNPANGTGTITSMSFYFLVSATGVKCGTFVGSGTTYSPYDNEAIGDVTAGSKQTFTGLSCDVVSGYVIGIWCDTGEYSSGDTGSGVLYIDETDGFSGTTEYNSFPGGKIAIEGTGATPASGVEYNGITISEFNGVAIASFNKA